MALPSRVARYEAWLSPSVVKCRTVAETANVQRCRLWVKTGNAPKDPKFSAFVPIGDIPRHADTGADRAAFHERRAEPSLIMPRHARRQRHQAINYVLKRPAMLPGASRGSVMQMVVPFPGAEASVILPPSCCVTRLWTMYRPSPVLPCARLVVKNGSKT